VARRSPEVEEEHDEATEQGGWLFADSFLALMVIFLATISFVPDIKNIADTKNQYTKALTLNYATYQPTKIASDIRSFIVKEKLPGSSTVVFARIIGGAPDGPQSADNGYLLALKFSIDLQRDQVGVFRDTRFDLGSSKLIPNKTVTMILTLAP
jgi:hypothetical protein